jgi:hypothetical protein
MSTNENPPPDAMLDSIAALIRDFLVCGDHQLTVLTLWVVHTWVYQTFPTTPYLHIHSPEPECGKITCLQLLKLLSCEPWIGRGPDPAALMQRLVAHEEELLQYAAVIKSWDPDIPAHASPAPPLKTKPLHVMLLDDYHHTFSSSERQPLVSMLCGSTTDSRVLCRISERRTAELNFFSPKAFAGNGDLPPSLASRCIPIVLQRKRPSDSVRRISDGYGDFAAAPLVRWLDEWSHEAWNRLEEEVDDAPPCIPNLTARQQDCAEPLLRLAAIVGGDWPEKATIALDSLFNNAPAGDPLQLLADIRFVFAVCENPPYLSTRHLLGILGSLENRPWAGWTTKDAKSLARFLRRHHITSRILRLQQEDPSDSPESSRRKVARGYRLCDFQDVWERYLPALPSSRLREIADRSFTPCPIGAPAIDETDVTGVTGA